MKRKIAGGLALALGLLPRIANACAACVTGTERNRVAFLVTTIALSLLPLAMIGAGIALLRRRFAGQFEDRDAWSPPAASLEPSSEPRR